jgi:DNA repair exonuclease SbcCD ATPase subunit
LDDSEDVSSVESFERILQELRDIRVQLEERVRPAAQYAVQAEVERLLGLFEQRKIRLRECLTQIDRDLLDCRNHLTEYDEIRAELAAANERLVSLGAQALSLPEFPSPGSLVEIIAQRLQARRDDKA